MKQWKLKKEKPKSEIKNPVWIFKKDDYELSLFTHNGELQLFSSMHNGDSSGNDYPNDVLEINEFISRMNKHYNISIPMFKKENYHKIPEAQFRKDCKCY